MLNKLKSLPSGSKSFLFPERMVALHSMLINCGHSVESSPDYRWDGQKRGPKQFAIWQYTISGEGALVYQGKEYRLPPGYAMLVETPQESVYYLPPDSSFWEFIFISFNGSEIMRLWREVIKCVGPVIELQPESAPIADTVKIIHNAYNGKIATPYAASGAAYNFILSLMEAVLPHANRIKQRPAFIDAVINYCLENPDGDLSIDALARVAGYSRYHFSREFHRYQGMPPAEFVNRLRIKLAVRLLQTERLTVKEIADRCGFAAPGYFCRVFRNYQGMTPDCFRLNLLKST